MNAVDELEGWLDQGGARHLRVYKIGGAWYAGAFDWSDDVQKQVKLFEACGSDEATAREHLAEDMRDAKAIPEVSHG